MFNEIDSKKAILDSKSPLPEYTLKSIRENLLLEWTYNSNTSRYFCRNTSFCRWERKNF